MDILINNTSDYDHAVCTINSQKFRPLLEFGLIGSWAGPCIKATMPQRSKSHLFFNSASLMSSLAHTRAGITDAMITSGSIELLVNHLSSLKEQVRRACAIALGKHQEYRKFSEIKTTLGIWASSIVNSQKYTSFVYKTHPHIECKNLCNKVRLIHAKVRYCSW